ncbi:MAG: hypothetical protein EO766_11585 [Hydrotalea sp. AMD]|uniref:hypothetical protein n=1 Tax=Hydrotalea sp. AMD TaxID=2501297 RepID=UPI001026108D|nr:hypothetical protein [Hydrotalea sp. AMD]RWZ87175.1 MAG: hypothetical protein EO766_11585 [Hydrotalea sp. AMD]
MTLDEITNKIKLTVTLIENGVVWLENEDQSFTADIPLRHTSVGANGDPREFEIDNTCDIYWCYDTTRGYYFVAHSDINKKILFVQVSETDMGFEIVGTFIFHIRTKH